MRQACPESARALSTSGPPSVSASTSGFSPRAPTDISDRARFSRATCSPGGISLGQAADISREVAMSAVKVLIAILMFFLAPGCIAPNERGYPLCPVVGSCPPKEVARLDGYVKFVDSRDVSAHGTSFELTPGCHFVGTPSEWGRVAPGSGGVIIDTGRRTFAIPMRAGYRYHADVRVRSFGGSTTASGDLETIEQDASGRTTRVFRIRGARNFRLAGIGNRGNAGYAGSDLGEHGSLAGALRPSAPHVK